MKKLVSLVLAVAVMLSLAGCGLFSKADTVKLGDYTHNDPSGLSYDTRLVLKNEAFGEDLASRASEAAYPDTMMLDDNGMPIGVYDYDETTGLAKGWMSMADGSYTAFEEGKEVDLGMPDESKMVSYKGDVSMYFVVYGNKDKAVEADMYLFLGDKEDKQPVMDAMKEFYGVELTAESDTVLKTVIDADAIAAEFKAQADQGFPASSEDAESYASILNLNYGVKAEAGPNPYKPYAEHKDPSDLEFDQTVVMTGSGKAALEAKDADKIVSQTDYLYGKDGKMVAQYTYYEFASKDAADELSSQFMNAQRVSDTVILVVTSGQDLQASIQSLTGFGMIKDDSVEEYAHFIEENFSSAVYK